MSGRGQSVYVVYSAAWPIAVGTLAELCRRLGRSRSSLMATATLTRKGRRNPDYGVYKVEADDGQR